MFSALCQCSARGRLPQSAASSLLTPPVCCRGPSRTVGKCIPSVKCSEGIRCCQSSFKYFSDGCRPHGHHLCYSVATFALRNTTIEERHSSRQALTHAFVNIPRSNGHTQACGKQLVIAATLQQCGANGNCRIKLCQCLTRPRCSSGLHSLPLPPPHPTPALALFVRAWCEGDSAARVLF